MSEQGQIGSLDEFMEGEQDHKGHWDAEMDAAQQAFRKFEKRANRTVEKYLNDDRPAGDANFKLNLFNSNITTIQSMMFGKLPEITFSRRNIDPDDDIARVAAMILERMLNADIGKPNDLYSTALKESLQDRLIPGLGTSRVRYEFDKEMIDIAPVYDQQTGQELQAARQEEQIVDERAPVDYVHWRDIRWSPARTWAEVRWVAFRTMLTRDQLIERFGEKIAKQIPLTNESMSVEDTYTASDDPKQDAFKRGEIWEIWDKTSLTVYWWCKHYDKILDEKSDPLGLTGFFPCPKPMAANITTTAFMPIPDYILAQDLYNEIDLLENRIVLITQAVKVVGVYDQSAEGVKRMMSEAVENDLIPVDNWAAFAERGGISGAIDWMPVEEIASVLSKLIERRNDCKAMLYEISGISDIMRGAQASGAPASATERSLEARFASVKIQAFQDEFSKYATDLIRLRAEVVAIHFQPQSIVKQSNIMSVPYDQQLIEPAIELIKNRKDLIWRIQVKPESVAMVDYAQVKQERTEYLMATATYWQSASVMIEKAPETMPLVMEMLKWGLSGFKGSQEIEGVMDQTIDQMVKAQKQAKENPEPPPPSPEQIKQQMEQQKQQFEMQKLQMTQQFEQEKLQFEKQMADHQADIASKHLAAELQADLEKEAAQAQLNIAEEKNETQEMIKRETAKTGLAMELNKSQTNNAMVAETAKPDPKETR